MAEWCLGALAGGVAAACTTRRTLGGRSRASRPYGGHTTFVHGLLGAALVDAWAAVSRTGPGQPLALATVWRLAVGLARDPHASLPAGLSRCEGHLPGAGPCALRLCRRRGEAPSSSGTSTGSPLGSARHAGPTEPMASAPSSCRIPLRADDPRNLRRP